MDSPPGIGPVSISKKMSIIWIHITVNSNYTIEELELLSPEDLFRILYKIIVHSIEYDPMMIKNLLNAGLSPDDWYDNNTYLLHSSAWYGRVEIVKALLEAGADIDAKTSTGWRALHLAIRNEKIDVVKILLEAGADLKARTDDNHSVFDLAYDTNIFEIILEAYSSKETP